MKKIHCLLTILLFCGRLIAQDEPPVYMFSYFTDNGQDGLHLAYSRDGYTFTSLKNDSSFLQPVLSKDKLMRDPCIIRGADGRFHMVWTVSWNERGIGYASSADLVNWGKQQYIPVMEFEPGAKNAWAPEITYDEHSRKYILYWASSITGRYPATDSLGDDGYNHRIYYTITHDFQDFSKAELLYDKGFNVIDATIRKVDDQYLMFLKDETKRPVAQKNIRIAASKDLLKGFGKASKPITGQYWAEGPTVAQVGKEWIVYFDKYTEHAYGAVSSTDLVNWKDISGKLSFPKGARHGTVFRITEKELSQLLH